MKIVCKVCTLEAKSHMSCYSLFIITISEVKQKPILLLEIVILMFVGTSNNSLIITLWNEMLSNTSS